MPTAEQIAQVCHEANRAWCVVNGDCSQVAWCEAPAWQTSSAIEGVRNALDGASPKELHASWCKFKRADGWRYGAVKDARAKTHPCLVPYAELPHEQQLKDAMFGAIVAALSAR